ncbi:hypothetical protein DFH08DRAFT_74386 [Mycena albidolilacea]|uniref:Uncharacterized protein n=1 Tax=Mycena albidolilacea TaxID=1033008 RepID=A0AAD6YZJ4_9AGAR|nr:hypothetical protein DFH08DRAFT_74386 [Mycena albidolilacea]
MKPFSTLQYTPILEICSQGYGAAHKPGWTRRVSVPDGRSITVAVTRRRTSGAPPLCHGSTIIVSLPPLPLALRLKVSKHLDGFSFSCRPSFTRVCRWHGTRQPTVTLTSIRLPWLVGRRPSLPRVRISQAGRGVPGQSCICLVCCSLGTCTDDRSASVQGLLRFLDLRNQRTLCPQKLSPLHLPAARGVPSICLQCTHHPG